MQGVINIYKEKGYTSHDVVNVVRKIFNIKKVGHTGTLDPDAEGVLPVCIGKATKIADHIQASEKEYLVTMKLGITTTTGDASGEVLETRPVSLTENEIVQGIMAFECTYDQMPPMYSAIKINGKKLYELAREGKEVERKKRSVSISNIRIEKVAEDEAIFYMTCTKGTYVRSLCEDIGTLLKTGVHMQSLTRTRSGSFAAATALRLDALKEKAKDGTLQSLLTPIQEVLKAHPRRNVLPQGQRFLSNGNPLYGWAFTESIDELPEGEKVLIFNAENDLAAIYEKKTVGKEAMLKSVTMLQ